MVLGVGIIGGFKKTEKLNNPGLAVGLAFKLIFSFLF